MHLPAPPARASRTDLEKWRPKLPTLGRMARPPSARSRQLTALLKQASARSHSARNKANATNMSANTSSAKLISEPGCEGEGAGLGERDSATRRSISAIRRSLAARAPRSTMLRDNRHSRSASREVIRVSSLSGAWQGFCHTARASTTDGLGDLGSPSLAWSVISTVQVRCRRPSSSRYRSQQAEKTEGRGSEGPAPARHAGGGCSAAPPRMDRGP